MSLPSYVINFDELIDLIKDYFKDGINVDVGDITIDTKTLENMIESIKDKMQDVDYNDLINALNNLGIKLDALSGNLGVSGIQRIYGKMLEITATEGKHVISFTVPRKGNITAITYSLSAWNFQDNWDLEINSEKIFSNVTTKEYGENKHFNSFYPVKSNDVIKFIFNNNSCSSKILWVDFNILEN